MKESTCAERNIDCKGMKKIVGLEVQETDKEQGKPQEYKQYYQLNSDIIKLHAHEDQVEEIITIDDNEEEW